MDGGRPKALPCSQISLSFSDSEVKTILTWNQQGFKKCVFDRKREELFQQNTRNHAFI